MDASETPYLNGRQIGIQTEWHENGQKAGERILDDGCIEGKQFRWYENGIKEEESEWHLSCSAGNITVWYSNGNLKRETIYDSTIGGFSGEIRYYPNGKKWFEWRNGFEGSGIIGMWNTNGLPIPITNVIFEVGTDESATEN